MSKEDEISVGNNLADGEKEAKSVLTSTLSGNNVVSCFGVEPGSSIIHSMTNEGGKVSWFGIEQTGHILKRT